MIRAMMAALPAFALLAATGSLAGDPGDLGGAQCLAAQIQIQDEVGEEDRRVYRNHGKYVSRAARLADAAVDRGEITTGCAGCIVSQFARRLPLSTHRPCGAGTPRGDTTIVMLPDLPEGFFSMPWPNDIRRRADGSIEFAGYPGTEINMLLAIVLTSGGTATRGFGTNAALYLQASAPIDVGTLPSAEGSLADDAPVMLVNLDDPNASRIPLLADFKALATNFRPGNLLTLLPYPGHPLDSQARYAAIVFDGLLDTEGLALRPAPLLAELDEPWDASKAVGAEQWNALREQKAAVRTYVEQHTAWSARQVLAFTVFSTQDVAGEMEAIAAAISDLPSPVPVFRETGSCAGSGASRSTVSGLLDLPRWQAGPHPFVLSGGDIIVVEDKAIQQGTERVEFELTFPCGPAPPGGWPILLFMDGTGRLSFAESLFIGELGSPPALPYVVLSIAPLFSGDRFVPGLLGPADLFFNFLNPLAARTNQLQQAADMIYLRRYAQGLTLSAAETGAGEVVQTNDELVVIAGHSQGALTIPHALAVDPGFEAAFLSAGGAGLYHSLTQRRDTRALLDGLLGTSPGELDMFHPVVHALQTITEVGDAANYARRVAGVDVLSIGGMKDGCSPLEAVSHLGTVLRLPVGNPLFSPTFGSAALEPSTTTLPVAGNLANGRTGATVQLDTGHFGATTNPTLGRSFVESLAASGAAAIAPGPLRADSVPGCEGRYQPLPTD